MTGRDRETRDQSTGGTCTWALKLSNGTYVYDLETQASGYALDAAQVWFSSERAEQVAAASPWIGASRAVRSRP